MLVPEVKELAPNQGVGLVVQNVLLVAPVVDELNVVFFLPQLLLHLLHLGPMLLLNALLLIIELDCERLLLALELNFLRL